MPFDLDALIVVVIASVAILFMRWATFDRKLRTLYVSAAVFAAMWLIIFSTNRWVELNEFAFVTSSQCLPRSASWSPVLQLR